MRRLAEEFPGALRELDAAPLGELEERYAAVEVARRDAASTLPWMEAQLAYHALARGALKAKRLVVARERAAAGAARHADGDPEVDAWGRDLASVAAPPRGRLSVLVFQRLAEQLGVDVPTARSLVLSPSMPPSASAS